MAQLAIRGHATRGSEVIELLEMLGGKNIYKLDGKKDLWHILSNSTIEHATYCFQERSYTLEEFEEKFPYKVGDKVIIKKYKQIFEILSARWCIERNIIIYQTSNGYYYANELQPYEENMEERKYADLRLDVDQDDKLATEVTIDGNKITPPENYLIGKITKVDNGMLVEFVKKQPQYPKTYRECCDVLGVPNDERYVEVDNPVFQNKLIESFTELLICRNAYWKIAGEEMGLGKPWEPDWENETCHTISYDGVNIKCYYYTDVYSKFAFPTKEMRDAFYENFKELINECKELL